MEVNYLAYPTPLCVDTHRKALVKICDMAVDENSDEVTRDEVELARLFLDILGMLPRE